MKTLYLDCSMGAAGDMMTAALLSLHPDPAAFVRGLNALGLPGVVTRYKLLSKDGLIGAQVSVTVSGEEELPDSASERHRRHHHHGEEDESGESWHHRHHHRRLPDVELILSALPISRQVRKDALAVYRMIANAESEAHGEPVEQIHFHELGELDAITDVLSVCLLMEALAPERVLASPIEVGGGTVRCAHGELPVPAPATAALLRGLPVSSGAANTELCTPTGAALLRYFVQDFGPQPTLRHKRVGLGLGKKELSRPNVLRASLGEEQQASDRLCELRCNLDDMSGEALGFAQEQLLEAGALDVWTQAIGMKKGRPGVMLCVLCAEEQREELVELVFQHTTTLGVRILPCERCVLNRRVEQRETPLGPVRMKIAEGFGVRREKPEYEDLARIAREKGMRLQEVAEAVKSKDRL